MAKINKYKYNHDTKEFSVESQKVESAYSYKTPEQFIREKGYKNNDILSTDNIERLGLEYIQNQIVSPDKALLHHLTLDYCDFYNKNQQNITLQTFIEILTNYACESGSQKLQFVKDLWLKD